MFNCAQEMGYDAQNGGEGPKNEGYQMYNSDEIVGFNLK